MAPMRNRPAILLSFLFALGTFSPTPVGAEPARPGGRTPATVRESAREIPIAREVDVVVVGGGAGAVAAATAAAAKGAKVFLAAPLPYLGDELTATLRLWPEEGETPSSPLARRIFSGPSGGGTLPGVTPGDLVPFTYRSSRPAAGRHPDTAERARLRDGRWSTAVRESVEYDGPVELTIQSGEAAAPLRSAHLLAYHARDYRLGRVSLLASRDGEKWREVARREVSAPDQSSVEEPALAVSFELSGPAPWLRFRVEPAPGSTRVLIGELAIVRARGDSAAPATGPRIPPARPFWVKKVLDDALIEAGVDYLYSSVATDLLRDVEGAPCGIAIANRAGRQAIVARVVIDATERASVARIAGAAARPFPPGRYTVRRVVVGGEPVRPDPERVREISPPYRSSGRVWAIREHAVEVELPDPSYRSRAAAEQVARDATWTPGQQFSSDRWFLVPPDPIVGRVRQSRENVALADLPLDAFRPRDVERIWVLGPCADVPRRLAGRLMGPLASLAAGERIGRAAAREAASLAAPRGAHLAGSPGGAADRGEVRELARGPRPVDELPALHQEARALRVLGEFDVVVVGGGTSGAPAGIGAARHGARTLVIEFLHGLGGVGTQGAISKYYWGNRVGFSATVGGGPGWAIEEKMEWWRKSLREAGAEIWFGAMGCGALVREGRVRGVVVATGEGRGVVLARVVVDATGNADIAAAAGAGCRVTGAEEIAMQGTGLPPRRLGANYTNTDFTIVDETDMLDVWRTFIDAKERADPTTFDLGRLIDTRERRRIVGELTITILDEVNLRTYPDTVMVAWSDFDTHGYTVDPYFTLQHPPQKQGFFSNVPYRAVLPRGLDGLLVTGLGLSAHRDALPLIRMQADLQNLGYAVGVAAALAARDGKGTRDIDLRELQRHLVEIGGLPERVLTDHDSFPLPDERFREAVASLPDGYRGTAVLLTDPGRALPLLEAAYRAAREPAARLVYAHALAVLGSASGVEDLIAAVEAREKLDKGWRYTGMGQYGPNLSPLDRLIVALGHARDRRATPAILEKLALLGPGSEFSHFRAVALALESLRDPAAAGPLAGVLSRAGIRGHAVTTIEASREEARRFKSWTATEPRNLAIREILLARALFRCGDHEGLGRRVLEEYVRDLRGHLSRHAKAVLGSPE